MDGSCRSFLNASTTGRMDGQHSEIPPDPGSPRSRAYKAPAPSPSLPPPTTGRIPRMLVTQRLGYIPLHSRAGRSASMAVPCCCPRVPGGNPHLMTTRQQNPEVDQPELFTSEDPCTQTGSRGGGYGEDPVLQMGPRSSIMKVVVGLWGVPASRVTPVGLEPLMCQDLSRVLLGRCGLV